MGVYNELINVKHWSTQLSSNVVRLLLRGKCDKLTFCVRNYVLLIPVSLGALWGKEPLLSEFEIWPSVDWDSKAETIDNETKLRRGALLWHYHNIMTRPGHINWRLYNCGRFFNISTKQYCTGFNHVYNIAQDSTFKVYCTDSLRLHHIL